MLKTRTTAALSLIALGMASFVPAANAQEACDKYGTLAFQQQKQNESMKCGFSGDEWPADLGGLKSWCLDHLQDWPAMLQKRTKMIEECKSKS